MKIKVRVLFVLPLLLGFSLAVAQKPAPTAVTANTTQKCVDATRVNPDVQCDQAYEPVCGCDGKTYDNSCDARRNGVSTTQPGACPGSLESTAIAAVKAWEKAYNEGDAAQLENTFAKNAAFVSPDGKLDGSGTIGKFYQKTFGEEEGKITLTISDIISVADGYVLISGTYQTDSVKKATREVADLGGSYVNLSQVVDGKLVTVYHQVFNDTAATEEKSPEAAKAPIRD